MKYDIFISYRRNGGYETAKHLFDLLTRDGYKVSFDIDTLRNGDFDTALFKRIDECNDFILILNKGAFDRSVDPTFNIKNDWLRNELAYALKQNKNIVPIMLSGFEEFPDNLPADIAMVERKNGPKYDQYYFDDFYNRLLNRFLETKPSITKSATSEPSLRIITDLECAVYVDNKYIGKAEPQTPFIHKLPAGIYSLKFESTENSKYLIEEDNFKVEGQVYYEVDLKMAINKKNVEEINKLNLLTGSVYELGYDHMGTSADGLVPVCNKDKWYYLNCDGDIAFNDSFVSAEGYKNGFAKVSKMKKTGFLSSPKLKTGIIDINGDEIIPIEYDEVRDFSWGIAAVCLDNKWGFIEDSGKVIASPKYDEVLDFEDDYTGYCIKGKWGIISIDGEECCEAKFSLLGIFNESSAIARIDKEDGTSISGVVNERGEWIIHNTERYIIIDAFYDDRAKVLDRETGLYGFTDREGAFITDLKYDQIENYSEGIASVEIDDKFGYVNSIGKEITKIEFDFAWDFYCGYGKVEKDDEVGLVNKFGKYEIALGEYDFIGEFNEGLAFVIKDGKSGFINTKLEVVIPLQYKLGDIVEPSNVCFKDGICELLLMNFACVYLDTLGRVIQSDEELNLDKEENDEDVENDDEQYSDDVEDEDDDEEDELTNLQEADRCYEEMYYAKAIYFYKLAAEEGEADAQYKLGYAYENGEYVKKDIDKAIELYTKAAKQGHEKAARNLKALC